MAMGLAITCCVAVEKATGAAIGIGGEEATWLRIGGAATVAAATTGAAAAATPEAAADARGLYFGKRARCSS